LLAGLCAEVAAGYTFDDANNIASAATVLEELFWDTITQVRADLAEVPRK
jgi:hypothetical protein